MARQKRVSKKVKAKQKLLYLSSVFLVLVGGISIGLYHYVFAKVVVEPITMKVDPNIGIKAQVEEFFKANNAPEMIPIIKCESEFKHYNSDGTVLSNREGSSATGVAQILSSKHPDPKVLSLYNKRFNTNLSEEDIDITTLEGNLGYALMLYELRGTKDWECAKKFRFK